MVAGGGLFDGTGGDAMRTVFCGRGAVVVVVDVRAGEGKASVCSLIQSYISDLIVIKNGLKIKRGPRRVTYRHLG